MITLIQLYKLGKSKILLAKFALEIPIPAMKFCVKWSSTYILIYPTRHFDLTGTHVLCENISFICQAEFVLRYIALCSPNFSPSVLNPLVLFCGVFTVITNMIKRARPEPSLQFLATFIWHSFIFKILP